MIRVIVTDEFHTVWDSKCETSAEVVKLVESWLNGKEETPIYEISILIE